MTARAGDVPLSESERGVLMHSLGLRAGVKRPYRNHFCTGPGSTDWPTCEALTERGLMRRFNPIKNYSPDYFFVVTDEGCALLGVKVPT